MHPFRQGTRGLSDQISMGEERAGSRLLRPRGQAMNPLLLYELIEALTMLRSGRANDAAEALAEAMATVDADFDEARERAAELRADR